MNRSRRAALTGLLGSGALLAVETLGVTRTGGERGAPIAAVDDADAYLGLLPDADGGVQSGGVLFEGADRQSAPATFAVANQLHDAVSVTLGSAAGDLAFETVAPGACPCAGQSTLELTAIDPGTARTVAVSPAEPGTSVTDAIRISAETHDGATTAEAERTIALDPAAVSVLAAASHAIVLSWCGRSGSLHLSVLGQGSDAPHHCTDVSGSPYRRREWLIVTIDSTAPADSVSVSVVDGASTTHAIAERARNGLGGSRSAAVESVWTAPDVSTVVHGLNAPDSRHSSVTGDAAVAIDFGNDGFDTPDPPVVSVTLPTDE